jgi:hypothetical protein
MQQLNRDDLQICQRVFDQVTRDRMRFGVQTDQGYLSIAILELYRKGFRSERALTRIAANLPHQRIRR